MNKYLLGLAAGVALTLALAAVGTARDKEEDAKAQKAVLDVTKSAEDGKSDKELATKAAALKKDGYELDSLMKVYKIKKSGGVGFGTSPTDSSGIEAKLQELQRAKSRGVAAAKLKSEGKDLIKLAYLNIAMAEIAKPHFPKVTEGKNKKDWDRWLDDQKEGAKELIEAIKKNDGKAAAKAADKMMNACTECHAVFRK
jgi:hypothetical protein